MAIAGLGFSIGRLPMRYSSDYVFADEYLRDDWEDFGEWPEQATIVKYGDDLNDKPLSYESLKQLVSDSGLSTTDKTIFNQAVEKSTSSLNKLSDLQKQAIKLESDSFSQLEKDYSDLKLQHANLWGRVSTDLLSDHLEDLDTEDLVDMKQAVQESELAASDKETLIATLTKLDSLKEQYTKAYSTYVSKAAKLEIDIETTRNPFETSLRDNKVTSEMSGKVFNSYNYGDFMD